MIEFHGPVHVPVIGDRTGIETFLLKGGGQLRDLDRSFKQRVLGMEVKMGEHGQKYFLNSDIFCGPFQNNELTWRLWNSLIIGIVSISMFVICIDPQTFH